MNLKLFLFYLQSDLNNCHKCIHFIPHKYDDLSKCKLYKIKSNNYTLNEYAEVCRKDPNKCGINGVNWVGLEKTKY
jgi:hypothetical protein